TSRQRHRRRRFDARLRLDRWDRRTSVHRAITVRRTGGRWLMEELLRVDGNKSLAVAAARTGKVASCDAVTSRFRRAPPSGSNLSIGKLLDWRLLTRRRLGHRLSRRWLRSGGFGLTAPCPRHKT